MGTMNASLSSTSTMNRRQFVGLGAATAAAGLAGGSVVARAEETVEPTGADQPSFMVAPEAIGDDQISQTIEAEVVIVGGGTAGLTAAVAAAEAGGDVVLFAMGAGPIGRGGSNFAFHSKYREELGLEPVSADPFLFNQLAYATFNVDQDKWYRWYQNSEEVMNWFIDIMAEDESLVIGLEQYVHNYFDDPSRPEFTPLATHGWTGGDQPDLPHGDGQPLVVNRLAEKAEELGVRIFWNTTALELVRGGVANGTEGRVDAVIAQDVDGNYVKFVGSKGIILATGDFSRDREMMAQYAPQGYDLVTLFDAGDDFDPEDGKVYGGLYTGQGQKMGLWVGAAWQKTFPNPCMALGTFGGADSIGLLMDKTGKRFCNEASTGMGASSLIFSNHVFGGELYQIWDSAYAETGAPWPKRKTAYLTDLYTPEEMIESWDTSVEAGTYVKADTIEEVVQLLGLPEEAVATVERYNGYCEAGLDEDFFKIPQFLRSISTPPFYGYAGTPSMTFLTVMGGLRTNLDMQVCDANDEPIEGLYNIGTMVGDCYSGCYSFNIPGHNLGMNCITYGYLTGRYVVENG